VVVQVAVSLVLVVGGALLVRSLSAAARVNLGYDADRTAYLSLALEMTGYDAARGGRFLEDGVQRLSALPQVEAVALTSRLPLSLNNNGFSVYIDGQQLPASGRAPASTARTWTSGISTHSSFACWRVATSNPPIATSGGGLR
jgi:hypothetical protein